MIDIGANLASSSFDSDLSAVIERAFEANIEKIIVTGSCYESNEKSLDICQAYPEQLYCTAGLHPHHASDWSSALEEQIVQSLQLKPVVAIGETGLDYNRNFSSPREQRFSFAKLLELAQQCEHPLFLHQRDAHEDFFAMLGEHSALAPRAVVHCFTDRGEALETYLDMGTMIGITGWLCDKKRGERLRDIVHLIPDDSLLIESDAPYLMPNRDEIRKTMAQKNRNEPCTLPYVVELLASLRGQTPEHVIQSSTANAKRFFNLT